MGLDDALARAPDTVADAVARITSDHKGGYEILSARGHGFARSEAALFRRSKREPKLRPTVGDWVVTRDVGAAMASIEEVLPRTSLLARQAAGTTRAGTGRMQLLAANVDLVLVTTAVGADLSPRRLERYLALAADASVPAWVVVTKIDTVDDPTSLLHDLRRRLDHVHVVGTSVVTREGVDEVETTLGRGRTVALLGSSGVGKSSLVNCIAGADVCRIGETRGDGKGRHTTTQRSLVPVPRGGALLDTPGLREVTLLATETREGFDDVAALAESCRFRDCRHQLEPACAVRAAVAAGSLSAPRLASFLTLTAAPATVRPRSRR